MGGTVRPGRAVPGRRGRSVRHCATAAPASRCPPRLIGGVPSPGRRRPGLALIAGAITLWLGLVANVGQVINGDDAASAARVPDRLSVVRVEAGESLADVAHRVAPDAPARQVAERIRELNDLKSPTLAAGQTLIAPIG